MSHGAVGTEHLVLALMGVDGGIVAEVFAELGITSGVRREVRKRLGPGPDRAAGGQVPFSPLAKRALELSLREALACGDQNIRPEHLLLAVSGMGESGGSEILRALGASPDLIGTAVRERVRGPMVGRPIGSQSARVPDVANPAPRRPWRGLTVAPDVPDCGRSTRVGGAAQRFGLEDLLRVCVEDERAARLLSELGVDVDVLRERLRRRPPAA